MKLQKITGCLEQRNNDFFINNFLLKRTGNYDTVDKLLIKLVGHKIECSGLIYNNVFFLHSYILCDKGSCYVNR